MRQQGCNHSGSALLDFRILFHHWHWNYHTFLYVVRTYFLATVPGCCSWYHLNFCNMCTLCLTHIFMRSIKFRTTLFLCFSANSRTEYFRVWNLQIIIKMKLNIKIASIKKKTFHKNRKWKWKWNQKWSGKKKKNKMKSIKQHREKN